MEEDEQPEWKRPQPKIDMSKLNAQDPEGMLKMTKQGRTLMMFASVSGTLAITTTKTISVIIVIIIIKYVLINVTIHLITNIITNHNNNVNYRKNSNTIRTIFTKNRGPAAGVRIIHLN